MKTMHYSNPNFNRASELRLTPHLINNDDLVLIIDKDLFVFENFGDVLKAKWLPIHKLNLKNKNLLFLGVDSNKKQLWATQLENIKNNKGLLCNTLSYNIRDVFKRVSDKEKALLTYALGIIKWSLNSNFCGVCSSETIIQEHGHSKICKSEKCKTIFYPQISPAIIVLIEHQSKIGTPKCLLQTRNYKGKAICSTFAGFVEIGESLEDAVKREMKEEVNVEITSLQYINSQPWMFSSSLMVGYFAQVDSEDYNIDGIEIKNAKWFTAEELKDLVNKKEIQLSLPDSIARYLIESWINKN